MMRFLLPLAATLVAATAAPAFAQEDRVSITVRYADLDLTRAAGQAVLHQRVQHAAMQICGDPDIRDLPQLAELYRCRKDIMNRVAPKIALAISGAQRLARQDMPVEVAAR